MLYTTLSFFTLALIAFILGANGIAGLSTEIGKILFIIFLIMTAITFIQSLRNRSTKKLL